MQNIFTAQFFRQNRQALRKLLPENPLIIVTAHGLLQRSADTTFTFQQDSNFWYLTGIQEPDIVLVMDAEREYLVVPERNENRTAFDGAIDTVAMSEISGVGEILAEHHGWEEIGKSVRKLKNVATPGAAPGYIEQYGMYTNPARRRLMRRLAKIEENIELQDIRQELSQLRIVKYAEELQAIQDAVDVTLAGIRMVTDGVQAGAYAYEFEIESDLTKAFRTTASSGHAFAPIVASGSNAVTLHSVANNGPIQKDQLIVIDVGAEVSHYAADITRTLNHGTPTQRQQEVFAAVGDVQKYALSLLRPGVLLKEYEKQVEEYMGTQLIRLGLIKEPSHDAIRKYFPHATSHFLGLDVHDVGDYTLPLGLNMVITCEPGIYIPEEGIGVRIEDDVLITESGCKVLSDSLLSKLTA